MLILTRKLGEAIRIGDDITIFVKEIGRSHVRVGIDCPHEIKIYREEVYQNITSPEYRERAEERD